MITPRRLSEIARVASGRRIAVIGDIMLDEFLVGSVERISPEAPVPVLTYGSHHHVIGGAGNAARTAAALGAAASLVGLVGDDAAGMAVRESAADFCIDATGVVTAAKRSTTVKTRVIAETQQVVRIDREASGPVGRDARERMREAALAAVASSDAVVISDYEKGGLPAGLVRQVVEACRERGVPSVVDPKAVHLASRGATVLKPNLLELARFARMHRVTERDIDRAAAIVMQKVGPEALLVTRSEEGMSIYEDGRERVDIPALATEVHDVTGAGDTVSAVLALGLAAGLTLREAADLANLAAAVVVRKVGTEAPSWDEMASRAKE